MKTRRTASMATASPARTLFSLMVTANSSTPNDGRTYIVLPRTTTSRTTGRRPFLEWPTGSPLRRLKALQAVEFGTSAEDVGPDKFAADHINPARNGSPPVGIRKRRVGLKREAGLI